MRRESLRDAEEVVREAEAWRAHQSSHFDLGFHVADTQ
jgi:hypothetical protein